MTVERLIENTDQAMACPWPEDMTVQGGSRGVVFTDNGQGTYVTAFVEAFPGGTFLRGEGESIAEAELDCYRQYEVFVSCEHGPFEARNYRNGSGFCLSCGSWLCDVLPVQPEDPTREPSAFEKAFLGAPEALELLARVAEAQARHDAQQARSEHGS